MVKENINKLKVLFFGLGSIGKKHAKIIKNNYDFDLFAYRTKKGQEVNDLGINELYSLKDAFDVKPDIAFVTNPTFLHIQTCLECVKHNVDLFIEKPISHSIKDVDALEKEIKKRKLFSYIAFNLRFHPVISSLKKIIDKKPKPIYFRVICSSYLPSWRPNQDYSKSYSAKKEMGGGVISDLAHEFDYIKWLFGDIKKINGFYDTLSDLRINSEDILEAQISCEKTKGSLHLNYFSFKNERKIQIYFNDEYIEGDLIEYKVIRIINNNKKIKKYKENTQDTYKKQLDFFFKEYKNNNTNIMNNYSEGLKTFKRVMEFKEKK